MGALERAESTATLETIFKILPELGITFTEFAAAFESNLKRARRKRNSG